MRVKGLFAVLSSFLIIGTAVAIQDHHGWPNHGIISPGNPQPHGYASPHRPEHP
jgi:hypothetical protein